MRWWIAEHSSHCASTMIVVAIADGEDVHYVIAANWGL